MEALELAFRLGTAAFVIVAPTLMFLGLWHLLLRMRNGELVERVMADERVAEEWSGEDFATPLPVTGAGGTAAASGNACPNCGASNASAARFCGNCLTRL